MSRRLLGLSLALSLGMAATACSDDDGDSAAAEPTASATAAAPAAAPAAPAVCTDEPGDGVVVDADGRSTGEDAEAKMNLTRASLSSSSLTADVSQTPTGDLRMRLEAGSDSGAAVLVLADFTPSTSSWQVRAGADEDSLAAVTSNPSVSQTGRITVPLPEDVLAPLGESFQWSVLVADLGAKTGDACPDSGTVDFPG